MAINKIHYLDEEENKKIIDMKRSLSILGLDKIYGKNIALIAQEFVFNEYFSSVIDSAASDCFWGIRLENGDMNLYSSAGIASTVVKFGFSNNGILIQGTEENSPSIKITLLGDTGELFYDSEITRTEVKNRNKVEKTVKHHVINNGRCIYISKPEYKELGIAKVM